MKTELNLEPAFVLHAKPYRETSLIVDFFTKEHGRVTVVARSARGPRSRYRGLLQPFATLLISCKGRTELLSLGLVDREGTLLILTGDRLLSGIYLNELLIRCLHRYDPHPMLFSIYRETLTRLNQNDPVEPVLRAFEMSLLKELGYGFSLTHEGGNGDRIAAENHYRFDPREGFIRSDGTYSTEKYFKGETLLNIYQEEWRNPEVLKTAKHLMRAALRPLLGDKPIKSRTLFTSVKNT